MVEVIDHVAQPAASEVDWAELEAQLHDGGNGFGGGNFNDDGDDGHRWDDEGESRGQHYYLMRGGIAGYAGGLTIACLAVDQYDRSVYSNLDMQHPTTSVPVLNYNFHVSPNGGVELGLFGSIAFVMTALGVAIGHKLDKKRRNY